MGVLGIAAWPWVVILIGLQTRQSMESSIPGSTVSWLYASEQMMPLICEISVMPLSSSEAVRNIYVMMNGRCSAWRTWMLQLQINQRMIINTYRMPSMSTAPFKVFLQPLSQFICKINSGGSLLYCLFYSWRNGAQMKINHLRLSGIPTKVIRTQLPGPIAILRWHRDFHIINLSSSLCLELEEETGRPEFS